LIYPEAAGERAVMNEVNDGEPGPMPTRPARIAQGKRTRGNWQFGSCKENNICTLDLAHAGELEEDADDRTK
jgi:hypothetical protein